MKTTKVELRKVQNKAKELKKEKLSHNSNKFQERENAFIQSHPQMIKNRKKLIFRTGETAKKLMKSLPSTKKCHLGPLMKIMVTLPLEGEKIEFETITDGKLIENILLRRNKLHFSQASETPLATNKIIEELGFSGSTETAKKILNGTATIEEIVEDEALRDLLQSFQGKETKFEVEFDSDNMIKGYQSWSEQTTTSPLGRHLGHFHALLRPFKFDDDEKYEEITNLRALIIQLHFAMMQIAVKHRHVYDRWTKVVTQMIEQYPDTPKVHQLRVIHLYECDFSLLLKIYFRHFSQHCEDTSQFNDGCYGGRPNRRAIDPVIVDVTQVEMAIILRRILIRFNNDATACFDRIMADLATINIQSFGMPQKLTELLGQFLEFAKYFVKTRIKISKKNYYHSILSAVF